MKRTFGSQSMIGRLRKVLVKSSDEGLAEAAAWNEFGYNHPPDVEAAHREHEGLVKLLQDAGVEVYYAQEPQPHRLDSIFVFDPALVTNAGAIIGKMGKSLRRGEEGLLARDLTRLSIPILHTLTGDATLEGGDVLWLDPDTLIIARSYRTNDEGYMQVRRVLAERVQSIQQVHLPHWRGRGAILHLLSLISLIAEDMALVYLPLLPVPLVELLESRNIELIEVPDEEFATHGCNALALAPRHVLLVAGNRKTARRLRERGVEVWEYEGQEITLNRNGGPTCLTCPILREY